MTVSLQDYAAGDTNYVAKLNSNNDVLEAALNALQALTGGSAASVLSLVSAYQALFGTTVSIIGDDSYVATGVSTDLTVTSGYCYRPSWSRSSAKPAQPS